MKKVKLEIVALSHSVSQAQNYAVVLGEAAKRSRRRLPIVIGAFEAQAIAVAIERIQPTRPLTHDLIKNIFGMVDVELREIVIDNLQEGIFYSKLICVTAGREIEIDSRTSDALALAVRFNCPIYTYEFILDAAGIILDEDDPLGSPEGDGDSEPDLGAGSQAEEMVAEETQEMTSSVAIDELGRFSLQELNDRLKEVLEREDYELAVAIRDEIDKRKREGS
jgi:bifunctional DNase/RNase